MSVTTQLTEFTTVGVVQTTLDYAAAWTTQPSISAVEEAKAVEEIRRYVSSFYQETPRPDVVLFPELSVPQGFDRRLRSIANKLGSVIIAGMDYRIHTGTPLAVSNDAIVVVPSKWRGQRISRGPTVRYVGKTYAAPGEKRQLAKLNVGFRGDGTVWLFDGGPIGKFGVAICYDFLDLDRLAMYRGQLQHLFILAYNKDTTSFDHAAEAVSRAVFCNVVICNCGYYGGSVALSPYHGPERRTIYRASGAGLGNAQMISLPTRLLAEHQLSGATGAFKSLPPGFPSPVPLTHQTETF